MTIAPFSSCEVMNKTAKWTVLAGMILFLGQTTATAEDAVSVLMKQSLGDMAGKVATVLTVDYAVGAASDRMSTRARCLPTSWSERWSLN